MSDNGKPTLGFRIEIIVEPDGNFYHAYCPALTGLHTCGDSEQKAVENAKDAATAYIHSLLKHGDPIPVGIIESKLKSKEISPTAKKYPIHRIENLVVATA